MNRIRLFLFKQNAILNSSSSSATVSSSSNSSPSSCRYLGCEKIWNDSRRKIEMKRLHKPSKMVGEIIVAIFLFVGLYLFAAYNTGPKRSYV